MTITKIEINTVRLNDDISDLRTRLRETRSHIQELKNKMDAMNDMWDGDANAAMRQRFLTDHENMVLLSNFLEELLDCLETIRKAYDTCENNVMSAVNALSIG